MARVSVRVIVTRVRVNVRVWALKVRVSMLCVRVKFGVSVIEGRLGGVYNIEVGQVGFRMTYDGATHGRWNIEPN